MVHCCVCIETYTASYQPFQAWDFARVWIAVYCLLFGLVSFSSRNRRSPIAPRIFRLPFGCMWPGCYRPREFLVTLPLHASKGHTETRAKPLRTRTSSRFSHLHLVCRTTLSLMISSSFRQSGTHRTSGSDQRVRIEFTSGLCDRTWINNIIDVA